MIKTLRDAFRIKELRQKLLFTLLMIIVVRIGCNIPVPGVNQAALDQWLATLGLGANAAESGVVNGAFDMLSSFTGGSLEKMSLLALNITPYITSSIIMQLLTIAIPVLEEMQKEGGDGRKKIASITRYVTVGLAVIEATAMAISFGNGGIIEKNALSYIAIIVSLTAGSSFVMWIGERITDKGIGNGISIVLLINIISRIPGDMQSLFKLHVLNRTGIASKILAGVIVIAIFIIMVLLVVLLNSGLRKIPVQYARHAQAGSRLGGAAASSIPIRINTAGVIPIIFASSIMQTPGIISSLVGYNQANKVWNIILGVLNSSNWMKFNKTQWYYSFGLLLYIVLVIVFAYFYTSITFNPIELADNLKKSNGLIPGVRPGKPTSDYLTNILNAIIFIGAIGLVIVGILPYFFYGVFEVTVTFLGTSLIIIVSVIIETLNQIESMMLVRNYKGFLNQ